MRPPPPRLKRSPAVVERLHPRQLFSATLALTATADGDTFTLVQAGDVVNLYHNQPTTGTPEATVPVADLAAVVVNGVGTTTVNVDLSGGNPIPTAVSVDSGTVAFNQNLGADGNAVAVSITAGATAKFNAVQQLDAVDINVGGTFTTVVPPDTTLIGPVAQTAPDELSITSQLVGDTPIPVFTYTGDATLPNLEAAVTRCMNSGGFDLFKGLKDAASNVGKFGADVAGGVVDVAGGITVGGLRVVGAIVDGTGKVIAYVLENGKIEDGTFTVHF